MQTFSNIFNGESGSSVRGKLNNVLTSIISGSEGINAIWAKIESVTQRINGMDSGISHIVKDTSYNPSSLDPYKNAVLIALCTGTFNNIKDKNGTPITIPGSNALTIFYREANTTYWEYDTQEIFTAVDSYESNDYSKIGSAKTHVMTHSGNNIKPMTDFNSVYDLDGNNLTKAFERLHTKVSSKAGLSNSEQSISAKKVLVTGGYEIDNQGEEATISYDGGVQDGNSFLKFTDSQNGGLIKLVFDDTEDTITTQNQFNSRINPISSRVDTIEQDMTYVNEMVPNLKLRCDNLEEDAKIVLASMGTSVDNEGNNSDVTIMYVPSVDDRYYDTSTGHIKWVKSSTITEDLGLPSEDRIYCNRITKRLYVFKNGWKKVGEPNEDLSSLKSNVASNSENIQSIVNALSTKKDKLKYVYLEWGLQGELESDTFYELKQAESIESSGSNLDDDSEFFVLMSGNNFMAIYNYDLFWEKPLEMREGYKYLIHVFRHFVRWWEFPTTPA